jgi:hypothetical protein
MNNAYYYHGVEQETVCADEHKEEDGKVMETKTEVTTDSVLDIFEAKLKELTERVTQIGQECGRVRAYGRLMRLEDVAEYATMQKDINDFRNGAKQTVLDMRAVVEIAKERIEFINENYDGAVTKFEFLKPLEDEDVVAHLTDFAKSKAKLEVDVENALRMSMELASSADDIQFRGRTITAYGKKKIDDINRFVKVSATISVCSLAAMLIFIGGVLWMG